ncbi:hypothetical protein RMATCC62417_02014 [Rhizopus microsporus]|nr:hypothetical protein RMATCC62417_02014 [Rhizopus microsporus]
MLTDSSLTNILVVSGVSQIRYRVYHQYYIREQLIEYLKKSHDSTNNHNHNNDNALLKAYAELLSINIPAFWQICKESLEDSENKLLLELWVFWFDDGHTGRVDSNEYLRELDEIKIGSFTWENAYSKLQSPTASPPSTGTQANASTSVTVSVEYGMFIRSVRNLLDKQIKGRGAVPLGEFYIFPNNDNLNNVMWTKLSYSQSSNTSLCCSYNVYLANTNLVFQPNPRRMRVKSLTHQTLRMKGQRVILSPSGEFATIASNNYTLPKQTEETILKAWSSLLDIPYKSLIQHNRSIIKPHPLQEQMDQPQVIHKCLPNLIALKSATGGIVFYYPTALTFVPSSSKISPTAMAGTNGLFRFNQGFSETFGDKWSRWAWNSTFSNYWQFACPRGTTISSVLDMLALETANVNQTAILQKVMNETMNASPLMVTASMATPASTNGNQQRMDASITSTPVTNQEESEDKPKIKNQQNLSLVEFTVANFSVPEANHDDIPEYPQQYANANVNNAMMINNTNVMQQQQHQQQQQMHMAQQIDQIKLEDMHAGILANIGTAANNSTYQSPQMTNLGLDPFGLGDSMDVDNIILDIPNRWSDDDMADLDNFDLGVTEEDFDFFKSKPVPASNAPMPVKDEMFIDTTNAADSLMLMADIKQEDTTDDFNMLTNDKLLVLDDKNQVMMDTEMENAAIGIQDLSVTPLEVAMAQQENLMMLQGQQQVDTDMLHKQLLIHQHDQQPDQHFGQGAKMSKERQLFIPSTFAPVKIDTMVNDSKYHSGGKFTYPSTEGMSSCLPRGDYYRPDYVPASRSKKLRKKKMSKAANIVTHDKEGAISNSKEIASENNLTQNLESKTKKPYSSAHVSISSSNSSSSSSDSSSDYTNSSGDEGNDSDEDVVERSSHALNNVSIVQHSYLDKLLSTSSSSKITPAHQVVFDYDSPFANAVTESLGSTPNQQISISSQEDYRALEYLCQQAVLGGYPFSGGTETISSNGTETTEGESTKIIISRRRHLLQAFYGDTIHVCSTPHDAEYMNQNFKDILISLFTKKVSDLNPMGLDQPLLPISITVKGPLNLQQYYDLSETNQAHSKYGKYQVKRRRPAEPNLDTLRPPNIVINRQEEFLEGSTRMIMFWEKLRLEPYSCKKHINYFVMYPKNDAIEYNVSQFFKNLGTLYETCQLGSHHPGNIGVYRKGLVPVTLLPSLPNESFEDRQIRSYAAECQNFGTALGNAPNENVYHVVYLLNPLTSLSSNIQLTRCFGGLMEAYSRTNVKTAGSKPVMQLVPAEHVLRPSSFGGCLKFGLKEMAFSVYTKCHAIVTRQPNEFSNHAPLVAEIYAPPFVLPKPVPNNIQYSLKKKLPTFPTILDGHAVLHIGYCFSFDDRWMIIVWTDNNGELIEYATLDSRLGNQTQQDMFGEAWRRTKAISKRTGYSWTFVIAKLGLMFEDELKTWLNCTGSEEKAAIVCLDLESPLHVSPIPSSHANESASSTAGIGIDPINNNSTQAMMNPGSIGGMGSGFNHKKPASSVDEYGTGQTKALLLNHRVAYSTKRERASLATLTMNPISATESWMIPLASGYMIHTPLPTENSCHELFNCNPPVIEIHLVFNQTNHSAYSTLRDIIKKYHDLSFVNIMPSNNNCFPIHLALIERLSRILLVVNA